MDTGIAIGYTEAHFRSRYTGAAAHALTPGGPTHRAVCGASCVGSHRHLPVYDDPPSRVSCKRCRTILKLDAKDTTDEPVMSQRRAKIKIGKYDVQVMVTDWPDGRTTISTRLNDFDMWSAPTTMEAS